MRHLFLAISVWLVILAVANAQPSDEPARVRVVDVGAGLCCVVSIPGNHFLVYDAGNFEDRGYTAMSAIEELIPEGSTIDLMVVSHCDADHLAAIPFICENYKVGEVWREGFPSSTQTWARANAAIHDEAIQEGCIDRNLQNESMATGHSMTLGEAKITFLCGFADVPNSWGLIEGEDRNARSVVIRLDYGGSSILIGGDSVGRHIGDPVETCIAAERFMVDNANIDVDVVVAPHHGADNGSSLPFIQAASPEFVVFSAGSKHHHPHKRTAARYLSTGLTEVNIFRTDRGDNEGSPEWKPRTGANADPPGDDDVEIDLAMGGEVNVRYRSRRSGIPNLGMAMNAPPGAGVSPAVRKWIQDDSLWTETHEHLEDHTVDRAAFSETQLPIEPITVTCCEKRPSWRPFRRLFRRCR